jgi:membrane protein
MSAPFWQRLLATYRTEIWRPRHLGDKSLRGRFYAGVRIISLTLAVLTETQAASRAAALSFSSLLGLGPLVALTVMVAGFMLDKQDPAIAAQTLSGLIEKIAPQLQHLVPASELPSANGATTTANPDLMHMIEGFISGSRNGAVGAMGAISLIAIVLQLFTSVESSFNEIWGVRQGRAWLLRIVYYWTVLTLGAVLFFAAITGLSAGAVFNAFETFLPYGASVVAALKFLVPAGSLLVLVAMLTLFYRTIPNTHVWWRAALVGALVVATLLVLNNYLAFLYLKRVVLQKSLYGSLGLLPVLMFGLYVFWFFVLLGGQVSYAVQNVNVRNSQAAWNTLPESLRERLCLSVLLQVARRFHGCQPPCSALQLGNHLKVSTQVINECLNRLVKMNLISPVALAEDADSADHRFQPARPLSHITLGDFKRLDDDFGGDPGAMHLSEQDPLVNRYQEAVTELNRTAFFQQSLEELLTAHPLQVT